MNPMFTFEYTGKTADTHTLETVKNNLSRLFAVSASEWDKVFFGKARFVKYDLDEFTATLYFDQFKKAGAIGKISSKSRSDSTTVDNNEESENSFVSEKKRSAIFFKIAMFLFVLVFTVDSFFQYFFFDIGTFVYLLPMTFFSIAAYWHMVTKGYPGWIGAFTGASIVGIPFLLFIQPRNKKERAPIGTYQALLTLLMVIVLVYFVLQKYETNKILENYQQLSYDFSSTRGDYPNGTIKDEMEIRGQINRMKEFILAGVAINNDRSLRAGQQSELATLIHNVNASFLRWMNYQRYLFLREGEEIPGVLSKKNIESLRSELLDLYKEFYIEHKQYISEDEFYVGSQISNAAHNASIKYRFEINKRTNNSINKTPYGLLKINAKIISAERNIEEGIYEIEVDPNLNSISRGKHVAVAIYNSPKTYRFDSDKTEFFIIGGNVPEYDFGVISMFEDFRLPMSHNSAVRLLLE